MPPPSPSPGWARGDVCREMTARLRTTAKTLVADRLFLSRGRGEDALVLVAERLVHRDECLLLRLGDLGVPEDLADQVVVALALLQDSGPHVERLGRDAQRLGDLLEDLGRRLPQATLDLAQVRVGDPGLLRELPQRQPGHAPLLADELTQVAHPFFEALDCFRRYRFPGGAPNPALFRFDT